MKRGIFVALAILCVADFVLAQTNDDVNKLLMELESSTMNGRPVLGQRNPGVVMKQLSKHRRTAIRKFIDEAKASKKDWHYRCAIMRVISEEPGADITGVLISHLNQAGDANLQACAAQQLGVHKDPESLNTLIDALNNPNEQVRASVASALGALRDKRAVAPLAKALRDKHPPTAINAIWAIGEIGDESGLDPLLASAPTMGEIEKINLIAALGKIGGARARATLAQMRKSANSLTIELINETIKKMRPEKGQ